MTCSKMAFVHRQSCEWVKNELDLFVLPPTQTSIDAGQWVEHQPMASLDSGGPIEFLVPGSGQYLPVRTIEGNQRKRSGPRSEQSGRSGE